MTHKSQQLSILQRKKAVALQDKLKHMQPKIINSGFYNKIKDDLGLTKAETDRLISFLIEKEKVKVEIQGDCLRVV